MQFLHCQNCKLFSSHTYSTIS